MLLKNDLNFSSPIITAEQGPKIGLKVQNDKCMNGKNLKSIVFIFGLTDKTFQLIRSIFSFRIEMKTSFERTEKRSNP